MAKKKQQPQLPAWVWLFTGVVTGLFAAFLVYLANVKGTPVENGSRARPTYNNSHNNGTPPGAGYANSKPATTASTGRPSTYSNSSTGNASSTASGNAASSDNKPGTTAAEPLSSEDRARRFEFYTLLPEAETLGAPNDDEKPTTKTDTKPADAKAAASKQRTLLQTGSFQRAQDAEKLRAQILLLGLPASIQRVEARPGETWHRVQAGPFNDPASLASAQKALKDARIQHIVIRPKNS